MLLLMVVHLQIVDPCFLHALCVVVAYSTAAVAQLSVVRQEVADGAKLRLMSSLLVLHLRQQDEVVHLDGRVATGVTTLETTVMA